MFKKIYHTDKRILILSLILSILVFAGQAVNLYIEYKMISQEFLVMILLFFGVYFFVFWMDNNFFSTYYQNNTKYLLYNKTQRIVMFLLLAVFLFIGLLEIPNADANNAVLMTGVIHFVYLYLMCKTGIYKKIDELVDNEYLLSVSGYNRRNTWK